MKVVLAEKPSVARDIARCLKLTGRKKGYYEGRGCAVTWALGHLVELEEPDHYNPGWKHWSLDGLPMIPDRFEVRPRGDKSAREQLEVIRTLFHQADELICATDAGREGELIFRYIQHWTGCADKPFRRLWINSLTDEAIARGFRELRDGHDFDRLYQAARCRSEADWIVGLNATRFFTVKYRRDRELWTVGRVQTPVLAMIVGRDLQIERFRPADYWELHTRYREIRFRHETGRMEKREAAEALLEKVRGHDLVITDVAKQTRTFPPPQLFDLTELQRELNRRFGMTATRTLNAAQALYEKKHLTYPRTDSRYLADDLKAELPGLFRALAAIRPEAIAALDLDRLRITRRIVDDSKVTDHHAIIPTDHVPAGLAGDEARAYDAVLTRFIAAFYPPCLKDITTVRAAANHEPFRTSGTVVADPGWQVLYPHLMREAAANQTGPRKRMGAGEPDEADDGPDADEANQVLPAFTPGERGPHQPEIKTLTTKPPKPYTEASLLQAMETAGRHVEDETLREALKEKGLGTPATRAAIIETLIHRNYIERNRKQLRATAAGRTLIGLVRDERLKSAELTGEWEAHLKQIEQGRYDPDAFRAEVVAHTRQIISQAGEAPHLRQDVGVCPRCGGRVIEGQKGYGCSRWKDGCEFVIWKDQFGVRLSPAQATELLAAGRTTRLQHLADNGRHFYGTLALEADGRVGYRRAGRRAKAGNHAIVGACPRCGSDVVEGDRAYGCLNWQGGCPFRVWKTMSHRTLPKEMVRVLLRDGITPFIQKFTNQQGKRFDARLKLDNGTVRFDFTPPAAPSGPDTPDAPPPGIVS